MGGSEDGDGDGGGIAMEQQHQTRGGSTGGGCACHYPRAEAEEYASEEQEQEEGERGENHNRKSNMIVSPKEICRTLARGGQGVMALLYLETIDGEIEEVERDVALLSPLVQREVLRHGRGTARNFPVLLPKQVSPGALQLILDYCRFHRVPGRSDKERKAFDERFVRLDTRRLCELTSAADSLDMKPLGDLTSRALARMIEGKTPEQIREIFHLPDDLTEEEKLEPVKISTDDPRIRLLNRLYARKRKELQEKKLLKSGAMESSTEKQIKDERSVEDLVSFIDGDNKNSRLSKGKRKKNRRKKEPSDENTTASFRSRNDSNDEAVDEKPDHDSNSKIASGMGRSNSRTRGPGGEVIEQSRLLREQDKEFEEGDFDDDDGLDPALKEIVDREVEDFARRLNSDWLKRTQEILTLASSSQEHRHAEARVPGSNTGYDEDSLHSSSHMGNGTNGNLRTEVYHYSG